MIEHSWLEAPPAPCNPEYSDPISSFCFNCSPYLFNQGADVRAAALFFDGSVAKVRTGDAAADDARVLRQTGGVDGLWSRDTPFGENGYWGDLSYDGTIASHHILTTDGILGRDVLGSEPGKEAGR